MGIRRVEPEWLDELAANDRRAIHARRDLKRINGLMLQPAIMARVLLGGCGTPPATLIDIGCGDGSFMLRVARKIAPRWPCVRVVLLDRQDIVPAATRRGFAELNWTIEIATADVRDYLDGLSPHSGRAIIANLFLHHFADEALARLLTRVARVANFFAVCEPWRAAHALAASRMLWAIGCNDVTRHDAATSVQAGFRGTELSGLWPAPQDWALQEYRAALFTHCFAARKLTEPRA